MVTPLHKHCSLCSGLHATSSFPLCCTFFFPKVFSPVLRFCPLQQRPMWVKLEKVSTQQRERERVRKIEGESFLSLSLSAGDPPARVLLMKRIQENFKGIPQTQQQKTLGKSLQIPRARFRNQAPSPPPTTSTLGGVLALKLTH